MKFLCSNCFYEKDIPPDAEAQYAGKIVTCPKCKLKSRVDPGTGTTMPPPIVAATNSSAAKSSRLPLILGLGCGIPILALIALASLLFLVPSGSRSSASSAFIESVDVDDNTTLTARYDYQRIYIPLNTDYRQCIPYANRWIEIEIVRNGKRLEPTAGLYNIYGTPTELTCKTSDPRVCECSIVNGSSVCLDPKNPGEFTITIEFMGKQVQCNLEFFQVPVRVFDFYGNERPQKTSELIKENGFPDAKKVVFVKKSGETIDGFRHELTGVYEHWRYEQFPGLIIATSHDEVIAIMTEKLSRDNK
jgi:hypothetical protein